MSTYICWVQLNSYKVLGLYTLGTFFMKSPVCHRVMTNAAGRRTKSGESTDREVEGRENTDRRITGPEIKVQSVQLRIAIRMS